MLSTSKKFLLHKSNLRYNAASQFEHFLYLVLLPLLKFLLYSKMVNPDPYQIFIQTRIQLKHNALYFKALSIEHCLIILPDNLRKAQPWHRTIYLWVGLGLDIRLLSLICLWLLYNLNMRLNIPMYAYILSLDNLRKAQHWHRTIYLWVGLGLDIRLLYNLNMRLIIPMYAYILSLDILSNNDIYVFQQKIYFKLF